MITVENCHDSISVSTLLHHLYDNAPPDLKSERGFLPSEVPMPRPAPLSARRIERGSVVSGPCGLLAIVVGVKGDTAVLCRVLHRPRHAHRSDVPVPMSDCLMMGVMVGNKVRCRTFRLQLKCLRPRQDGVSADLLQRVLIAVKKEDAMTRWERYERRSTEVSRIYG
ncbi:hypothetical protein [Bombella saccharophila]|uniref:Uncharacterized protein n=1 Tax=Bombella saccharophila TaxID=2967338 RepID=A0ABT3WBT8_9PROT|nr:hypothetical protein [Bombella saccharophila]MCX5614426.1 hypothetical protein [Bombella saccharophila]